LAKFENIIPRKIKEELYYKSNHVYIFRFKRKTFKGYSFWAPKLEVRNLEYLGEAIERKFYPSELTWLQLIKEHEKRKCEHV
jgi:diadenosine tetraphosphate (Ap4A) HIT family hydrolase